MIRLLDRLAQKMVLEIDHLMIDDPMIDDADFEGVNPTVWVKGNAAALDRLDSKAGSLLTHISMMLAAATFMISAADTSDVERVIIGLELVCYLFLALICVRCLRFVDLPLAGTGGLGRIDEQLRLEVRRRSLLLNIAIRWMFLITFVFMLSVLVHIFL
ncbi:hypothetical protein SLH49_01530 [Cognatiyoonia sp. IB215446]|uniref:hypothetical protein n=1 Tax=Cognatiyoonia sp. IB215446 TaxID=3097355 RepID=UPI002A182EE8|nr:hypothetical protein [Cognatiyoonia sp. IB215446]MDX8346653.1 hypothetical protein [Cognatiyoonia sp. IB215446]